MNDVLLDSDILIDLLRGYPPARAYFKQIQAGAIRAAISTITVEVRVKRLLGLLEILNLDFDTAWRAGEIRRRYQSPFADSVIAATAIGENLPLFTKTLKHFQHITELTIQQPYT